MSIGQDITAGQTACQTLEFTGLINFMPNDPHPWHSITRNPGGNVHKLSLNTFHSVINDLMVLPLARSIFKHKPHSNLYVGIIAPFQGFNWLQVNLADPPRIHFGMLESRFFGNDHWNPANDLEFGAITNDKHRNI